MSKPITALELAPIRASVLPVCIGFLSAYVVNLLRKIETLSSEITNEAERVTFRFARTMPSVRTPNSCDLIDFEDED